MLTTQAILDRAVAVRAQMSLLSTEQKNRALLAAADALEQATEDILAANLHFYKVTFLDARIAAKREQTDFIAPYFKEHFTKLNLHNLSLLKLKFCNADIFASAIRERRSAKNRF